MLHKSIIYLRFEDIAKFLSESIEQVEVTFPEEKCL